MLIQLIVQQLLLPKFDHIVLFHHALFHVQSQKNRLGIENHDEN